jgi:hypothetical protein
MFVYISDLSALMPATEVRVLHHTGTSLMVCDLILWNLPLWCGTYPYGVRPRVVGPTLMVCMWDLMVCDPVV